jgi:uncharacterized protein DUF3106
MRLVHSHKLTLLLALALPSVVLSQTPADTTPSPSTQSNSGSKGSSPPPLPSGKSPVDLFRQLLAQSSAERSRFLEERSPESQKLILAKLREYESLTLEQRELRLQVTEMRWYLAPLLRVSAANRKDSVGTIPERLRTLVEARLQQWDKLPAAVQQQVLDNEDILNYYIEQAAKTESQPPEPPVRITPAQNERLEKSIRQWLAFSENQRKKVRSSFNQSLALTSEAKSNYFNALPDPERHQLELTLLALDKLTPSQRSECLRSFERLASMTAEERQEFLKSANHWERMTPAERQAWKNLVSKLSKLPPVPPGLGLPPVPGGFFRSMTHSGATPVVTNPTN